MVEAIRIGRDDLIDACACAVAACGSTLRWGEIDPRGLRMEITHRAGRAAELTREKQAFFRILQELAVVVPRSPCGPNWKKIVLRCMMPAS